MITVGLAAMTALVLMTANPPVRRTMTLPSADQRRVETPRFGWLPWRWRATHLPHGLADLVLLLAVGLLSGSSVSLTLRQIARTVDSPESAMVAAVVERQRRGQPLIDALGEPGLGDRAPNGRGAAQPQGAGWARVAALLRSQIEDGAAVADALLELSRALRDDARRSAEMRARRLPVRMLLPLILCVLPGFLCLTVAPVIVESLRGVSL